MDKSASKKAASRREIAYVGVWDITQMHLRNPYVVAFWSVTFAGFGHLILSKYCRGIIFVIGEIYLNVVSHLNIAIFFTVMGKYEMAKQVLDIRWLIIYFALYGFSIWDSYRETVDINNNYVLAAREDAEIKPFVINTMGLNYMSKVSPLVCTVWSAIIPGTGHIMLQRMNRAFFILLFWIVTVYFSRLYPAIYYTLTDQYDKAKSTIDVQWFINIPSIYFFAIYDAYTGSVENNKLYEWELSKFLKKEYQDALFSMPFVDEGTGENMYVLSVFQYSTRLENAVTALQMKGITKEKILVVPLDKQDEARLLFDRMHSSDSISLIDLPMILGMILMLFGSMYGFNLYWGPITWAVIGAVAGFLLGLAIKLIATRYKTLKQNNNPAIGVVVIVFCEANQLDMVKDTLWVNAAMGVGKLSLGGESST